MQSSKTPAIIGILLVVGAIFYYFYSQAPAQAKDASLLSSTVPSTSVVGADVLVLLGQINNLKIDTTFFDSHVYQSLNDFSVDIPTENVGKPDPFAPLPGSVAPTPPPAPAHR